MERESMEFDVVVVGAGPAGLSAAIKLSQLAQEQEREISVCVVEKGSEVGAHILSGAVLETTALDELLPDWRSMGSPLSTEVSEDVFYYYTSEKSAARIPNLCLPPPVHNDGNYIVSMGNVCRWLAEQAENLGIEVYPGSIVQPRGCDLTCFFGPEALSNRSPKSSDKSQKCPSKQPLTLNMCPGHASKS